MNHDQELRKQLVNLLTVKQAHVDFVEAIADFPAQYINTKAEGCSYSFWHLLEHLRLCQKDILEYIISVSYCWPKFPDDYWPEEDAKADLEGWTRTAHQFLADRQELLRIIQDPKVDLFAPLPNSGKHQHSILREINIAAQHNAYHTGELVILRKIMGIWPS